jgi:hypothetical protein
MARVRLGAYAGVLVLAAAFATTSGQAETLQEYARACDQAIGASVPQFNCLQGSVVPVIGKRGAQCQNPTDLNGSCNEFNRVGRLATSNPDVEIRFLCRHYREATGADSPYFNDIAVIQRNMKTGATCFYQSPTGNVPGASTLFTFDGRRVPAPSTGDGSVFGIEHTSGCVSCHDSRGFIKTPALKGIFTADAIPAPGSNDQSFGSSYYFPGETTKLWNAFSVRANSQPECTGCHALGTEQLSEAESGTAKDLGLRSVGNKRNASSTLSGWYGPYLNNAIQTHPMPANAVNSALAHAACARGVGSDCTVLAFGRPAPVHAPGSRTLVSLGYRTTGMDLPKPASFAGDMQFGQLMSPQLHACRLSGGRNYIWVFPDGVVYSYEQGPNYIAYDLATVRQAGCRLPAGSTPTTVAPAGAMASLSSFGLVADNASHRRPANFDSIVAQGVQMSQGEHQCAWAVRPLIYVFSDGVIYANFQGNDYNVFDLRTVRSHGCVLPASMGSNSATVVPAGSSGRPSLASLGIAVDNRNHRRPADFESLMARGQRVSQAEHGCSWAVRPLIYVFSDGVVYANFQGDDYNVFDLDTVRRHGCRLP